MLEWSEYISGLLAKNCCFDDVSLSLGDDIDSFGVPPIVKASILMLDRMAEHQGRYNIFVFPESHQTIFLFAVVKLLYNIFEGRIERRYDPDRFQPHEKLRFGNAVVEFVRREQHDGKDYMRIRTSDLEYSAPLVYLPLFQKTTAQRLSKYEKFVKEKERANELLNEMSDNSRYLKLLHDYKTHMDSSIVYMTSVTGTNALLSNCKMWEEPLGNNILVGKTDYQGNVKNIGAGQLNGVPAIVLASDLYAIASLVENGHPIQSVIIDGSESSNLQSQMDALDEVIRSGNPITLLTDTVNSFELDGFVDRGFNVWRWDESSITESLVSSDRLISDRKNRNCSGRSVDYRHVDGKEISAAVRKLFHHKGEAKSFPAPMIRVYDDLFNLSVSALRETVPFSHAQVERSKEMLFKCGETLSRESTWISDELYGDLKEVIRLLGVVYSENTDSGKYTGMKELLLQMPQKEAVLVIPEQADKKRIQEFWGAWMSEHVPCGRVTVFFSREYLQMQCPDDALTIVVGWFNQNMMRRILYSFNTRDYAVILYDCEKSWKNGAAARWTRVLSPDTNRQAIEKSFNSENHGISTERFTQSSFVPEVVPKDDEYDELEAVIRENKYRQYVPQGESKQTVEVVEAIPVGFVGGYMSFYKIGHKLVSATDVILNDADSVKQILSEELKLSDFVVVREADRDLIRDIADRILEREENAGARETAKQWQEALNIEWVFSSEESIYQRLCDVGFTRGEATLHRWLTEKDLIAPQSKNDLKFIAEVTDSDVLRENMDLIWEAAQTVKTAHIRAGRVLSMKLKNRIAEVLNTYGDFDPFNVWEPIEMQVEEIGTVRILKVIDIGQTETVDVSVTNRLFAAE